MESPLQVSSKLPKVGTNIFTKMSALANEQGAINLSQGFPDFQVAPYLIELVNKYMRTGQNQYAPMGGVPVLKEAIVHKMKQNYGVSYDSNEEVTITAGATQAIYAAITSVVKEGDEVVIFTPAYDCYGPTVELNGGKPVYVPLLPETYGIDWETVKKVVTRKTRMIIINTPHNPTGTVLTAEDMKELDKLTDDSDIIILSDEVYEHIVFDGVKHESVAAYPNLAKRSFAIYSFGKTFHATGWKMGYCLAPERLMAEFRKVHQFIVFAVNTPIQYALAEYITDPSHYQSLSALYQQKRDFFLSEIRGSRFNFEPSKGSYYQLLNYAELSKSDDVEYADLLTSQHKIASIPISVFYHNPTNNFDLRFCFAKEEQTLKAGAQILNSL